MTGSLAGMSQRATRDALSVRGTPMLSVPRSADDLAGLDEAQWAQPSLCGRWVIEEVVAHLTAAASIGPVRWFASVLGARFDFDLHNDRRLAEHRAQHPPRRSSGSGGSSPAPQRHWDRPPHGWVRSSCTLKISGGPSERPDARGGRRHPCSGLLCPTGLRGTQPKRDRRSAIGGDRRFLRGRHRPAG